MRNEPEFITRKEIGALIGDSVDVVRKNESRIGLDSARRPDLNKRNVRYRRSMVMEILSARGLLICAR